MSLRRVLIGFAASLALTLAAYAAVVGHWLSGWRLGAVLLGAAVIQLTVQLVCFLDLGFGAGRVWRIATLVSTVGLVLIVVGGSAWIMAHLNYAMMASPEAMRQYIDSQQGF